MNTEFPSSYPLNRFSIAPMLDLTDRHCRYFHRLLTKNTLLYTEMVTTGAIMFGKGDYLAFKQDEHPLALQLGGSDPNALAHCAKLAEQRYYDEINLNVGCPSDRVQNGKFGACLMAEPKLVADCVKAMRDEVTIPVTVKTRLGIDDLDSYQFLYDFIQIVSEQGGCDTFIIHARKAWLSGLSPKENRDIPPLDYSRVWQIKKDFPHLTIAINGGITSLNEAKQHLQHVDGVMMGRQAYQHPALLANVDHQLFATETAWQAEYSIQQGIDIIESFYPYIEEQLRLGVYLGHMTRHILGLFQGIPGAKQWRRYLSENAHKSGADIKVVEQALSYIKQGNASRR